MLDRLVVPVCGIATMIGWDDITSGSAWKGMLIGLVLEGDEPKPLPGLISAGLAAFREERGKPTWPDPTDSGVESERGGDTGCCGDGEEVGSRIAPSRLYQLSTQCSKIGTTHKADMDGSSLDGARRWYGVGMGCKGYTRPMGWASPGCGDVALALGLACDVRVGTGAT